MEKKANDMDGIGPINGQEKKLGMLPGAIIQPENKVLSERATWGKKLDFLLSIIGFAVDLGNVWRFPATCYRNGGGAFLIAYMIMYIFGGLPLFYMELALGQYQGAGCISVWERICPMFKGLGYGICVIAIYAGMYYNTIIAWALYYMVSSFRSEVPWKTCNNNWNTENCTGAFSNQSNHSSSPAEEFFQRKMLEINRANGLGNVGNIRWPIALCLFVIFIVVYFALWKGIKSSGKVVWVTATLPYVVLIILLVRGVTLPGSADGIKHYLFPDWKDLLNTRVWTDAASQIFFSLGPGFGVLLALASYNKFHNNCYRDALITSTINCLTSFLAGFVVFSVLGYMALNQNTPVNKVAVDVNVGLVFVVYPEAIATLPGSSFWAVIFFLMLITLGLDSTFGGLESLITGVCDEWPWIGKKHEIFVGCIIATCFLGGLATTTYGGNYVVALIDNHGPPIALLCICFFECIAVSWFYGVNRFCDDLEAMLGFHPGIFWKICWAVISPVFLITLFFTTIFNYSTLVEMGYKYPAWGTVVGWILTCSSLICIPTFIVYRGITTTGGIKERLRGLITPISSSPRALKDREVDV